MDLNTQVAHSARIYDFFLGGKDHYPADRAAAAQIEAAFPDTAAAALQNRAFLVRATRFLADEAGVRQFLDIGTGIPTSPNLHEVVQAIAPESRVVYVDRDPIVLAHARALLTSSEEGATAYVDADLRNPAAILKAPELLTTIDLASPVGLSLVAVLHFVPEEDDQYDIVRSLLDALPSGSYLTMTYLTADHRPEEVGALAKTYHAQGVPIRPRSRDEVARFFEGLELVEPGLSPIHLWRPDGALVGDPGSVERGGNLGWAAVGRKP